MLIKLPLKNFSFFKVSLGSFFLLVCLFFPKASLYASIVALFTGVAHFFGAWISMWRSKKLNWKYVFWVIFLIFFVSCVGLNLHISYFIFIAYLLFTFHFLYDEFDLQEEKRNITNIISSLGPTVLILFLLVKDFFSLNIGVNIFVIVALMFFAVELIFLKEINWFFVHTKILSIFILISIFLGFKGIPLLNLFLIYHYFFWFIYPVYKLHKYKREDRDGLIMILLLTIATSVYLTLTRSFDFSDFFGVVPVSFYIGTIVHILSTAPFGYLIGLPKARYEVS